jgi:hypothetical protein
LTIKGSWLVLIAETSTIVYLDPETAPTMAGIPAENKFSGANE